MRRLLLFIVGAVVAAMACPSYGDVTLYDSSVAGQTPDDQNLYYLALDPASGAIAATQSWSANLTTLDTTGDSSESAGYFNYDSFLLLTPKVALPLDRTGDGYTLRFFAQVVSEAHSNANRAGFSVIALSDDKQGIELGFWSGSVWAQDDTPSAFVQAESASFDTTAKVVKYDLAIKGAAYTLYGDGTALLNGSLRDYSAVVPNNLTYHAYHQADFVFLGDNTSSAAAEILLGNVEVLDAAVPEPASAMILLAGLATALARRRRS
ncbi:MAG: PEP-CTERM sorting domain-containing protein [bacterium]|nr:PEP-CTERM sorting domain-containing protein [bacterium]